MKLIINGAEKEMPDQANTVSLLLQHLDIAHKKVVIERNGNILKSGQHGEELVQDGDRLEIVHFVGGG
ncbi:sulfur carrier protein [Alteribacillus persepolensis]|uniref:Sulfur carrier protein n=1 Tax=Alteribacillus persepolensis TaxID=568899 RepID=A0A1G8FL87_9BACI|nr:sulfur carrier protein ThiS [Alteribacillus persepolensis]SDH82871.1 sulfur carrier protein [Alteribacillus persepolensis]